MEENKKLEAIMNAFKELSYDEKREKVISLVEWLWEWKVYEKTLMILKDLEPTEEYISGIYSTIMEMKLACYEEWKQKEKTEAQEKMQEYMHRLNELSDKQKEKDEEEADAMLSMI